MIRSYQDYLTYLESDRISLNATKTLHSLFFHDLWRFQRLMRKLEYFTNCKKNKLLRIFTAILYRRSAIKLGISIPINIFGPGLSIAHRGTIVVNGSARVAANCRLHVCCSIGTKAGRSSDAPLIGNNVYIGPGAKLFGKIRIGDNIVVGANAVVNKSFPQGNMTIGGIPAKRLSDKSSEGLLIKGYTGPYNIDYT